MFINPLLLWGAALAAIPVVLHLIMRQKPKHLEFPALRFLQSRREANRKRLRLRHWLLLAARMAALALIALALARPRMQTSAGMIDQEAPVAAVMVFDTLPHMLYQHNNQTRMERAKELARGIVSPLPRESQVAVLDSALTSALYQVDVAAAQSRIERLETVSDGQPLSVLFEEAIHLLEQSDKQRKEIYLFTDFTRAAWQGSSFEALSGDLDDLGGAGIYLVDVGVDDPQNAELGDLRLSRQVISKNSPLELTCSVSKLGKPGPQVVELYLGPAGETLTKRGEQSFSLNPAEAQQVIFPLARLAEGTHQGELRINAGDGLAIDDKRYFTVDVRPAWRVLIAVNEPLDALFLREALAPDDLRKRGLARYDCQVATFNELNDMPLGDRYTVVCLLDPPGLDARVWSRLEQFAQTGGGVAVFLGRHALNNLESFNSPEAQRLLAGKLALLGRGSGDDLYLTPNNFTHPMLAKFRLAEGSVPWHLFPVFRYWGLEDPHEKNLCNAANRNGVPALVERPVGRGRVLTMTTPISDPPTSSAWNELPLDWPFVMLADQMMLYLAGGIDGRFNYQVGQTAVIQVDEDEARSSFQLNKPDGSRQRKSPDPRQLMVVIPADRPGQYVLKPETDPSKATRGFSANLSAEQTNLTRLGEESLKSAFGEHPFHFVTNREEIERVQGKERVGAELFPFVLIFLALVTGVEQVLANRFYKEP